MQYDGLNVYRYLRSVERPSVVRGVADGYLHMWVSGDPADLADPGIDPAEYVWLFHFCDWEIIDAQITSNQLFCTIVYWDERYWIPLTERADVLSEFEYLWRLKLWDKLNGSAFPLHQMAVRLVAELVG